MSILTSDSWTATAASTLSVAYFHGQRDAGDDSSGDFFCLEYSTNGGGSWNTLASNGDQTFNASWSTATAQIPGGSSTTLRVQCADGAGPGDLVECGIDDVKICPNQPLNNKGDRLAEPAPLFGVEAHWPFLMRLGRSLGRIAPRAGANIGGAGSH